MPGICPPPSLLLLTPLLSTADAEGVRIDSRSRSANMLIFNVAFQYHRSLCLCHDLGNQPDTVTVRLHRGRGSPLPFALVVVRSLHELPSPVRGSSIVAAQLAIHAPNSRAALSLSFVEADTCDISFSLSSILSATVTVVVGSGGVTSSLARTKSSFALSALTST